MRTETWGAGDPLETPSGRAIHFRQAVEDDAPTLIHAMDLIAREGIYFLRSQFELDKDKQRSLIARARARRDLILVATEDSASGEVVGWVSLFRARAEFLKHTAELGMGVLPGYRGMGLGRALLERSLHWAAGHQIEKVRLGVRAGNHRALALYRSAGFVQEGRRVRDIKDQHGCYDDIVEMSFFVPEAFPAEPDSSGVP